MAITIFILWLLPLTFLSLIFFVTKIKDLKLKLPPNPPKLPIIGNLHQLRDRELPHRSLCKLSNKYGPVMLLRYGSVPVVILSSSQAAEQVLKTHDLECSNRPKLFASQKFSRNYQDIGLTSYSKEWRERRNLAVRELFSLKKVRSFMNIREKDCNLLVKKLSESASKQCPVNLSKTLFFLVASTVFRVVFRLDFHESKFIDKERFEEVILEAQTVQARLTWVDFFPGGLGWFIDRITGQHKRLEKVFVEIDTFLQKVIDDHTNPEITKEDQQQVIIDVMLNMIQHQNQDDSFKLTIDHIKGILSNVSIAGIDTSASTMIWAMTELARNPKQMKKVQDEIRGCLGEKGRITEEDLGKIQYLNLIIKETLRLHPPAPLLLPRETMTHIKIQGYDIPPKTRLLVNAWAIGRDPKYWTNPEEFNPERFIVNPKDYRGQHFEFLPFGSGRRICPGMLMGIAMVELGLLNLLYFFDWKLPEGMTEKDIDVEEAGTLTIIKKQPLQLVPVRRH